MFSADDPRLLQLLHRSGLAGELGGKSLKDINGILSRDRLMLSFDRNSKEFILENVPDEASPSQPNIIFK